MAAPWDGRLSTYLGKGLASARPATPNVQPGLFCLWFSTDTDEVSMWDGSDWVDNIFLTDAPVDDDAYVRKGGEWVTVTGTDVGLPETVTPGDVVVVNPDGSLGTATPVPGTAPVINGATKFRVVTVTAGADGGTAYSELGWYNRNQAHIIPISWAASSTTTGDVNDLGDSTLGSAGWSTTEGVGAWVEVEFATPTLLNSVVVDAYEGGGTNNTPVSWKFQFWDVGTAAWIDIGTPWTRSPPWDGSGTEVRICYPIDLFTPTAPVAPPVVTTNGGVTLGGALGVPDEAFGTAWNGKVETPTKNAIFDLVDTDTSLTANSDLKVPSQKAVKAYIATQTTGLWEFKGLQDCSGDPNYIAGLVGDAYLVNVAGKIGGASGIATEVGDMIVCIVDNAGGTQAAVGAGWTVIQANVLVSAVPYSVTCGFTAVPSISQIILIHVFTETVTFADNFAGSAGTSGVNPTASFVMDVQKNGASIGSITVSTGGGITFNTTGTTETFSSGDVLKVIAPAVADATMNNAAFTFKGVR